MVAPRVQIYPKKRRSQESSRKVAEMAFKEISTFLARLMQYSILGAVGCLILVVRSWSFSMFARKTMVHGYCAADESRKRGPTGCPNAGGATNRETSSAGCGRRGN